MANIDSKLNLCMADVSSAKTETAQREFATRLSKLEIVHRFVLFACSVCFCIALSYSHANYLSVELAHWGFPYVPADSFSWVYIVLSVGLVVTVLPLSFFRPSSVIIFVLYVLVFIPTITITPALKPHAMDFYWAILYALTLGFFSVSLVVRLAAPISPIRSSTNVPARLNRFVLALWAVMFFLIAYIYQDIINIVGLEEMYAQREAGRASNRFEGYLQLYFSYVVSPILLIVSLFKGNRAFVLLSFCGFILMYSITAERSVFLMPFAICLVYYALSTRLRHVSLMVIAMLCLTAITLAPAVFPSDSGLVFYIGHYLVFRVIAIPGAFFAQYYDVFSTHGFTLWSNVSGFDFLIDPPPFYVVHPDWPQLGYIVAEEFLGTRSNSNAGMFAYDGVAAAGMVGVLAISAFLGVFLIALDHASQRISYKIAALCVFPLAFALTNVSFFSAMLSFGGIFWLVCFLIVGRKRSVADDGTGYTS